MNSKRTTSYERLRKMGFSAVISIIIPVYNRQELVRETLDSIYEQTYQDWECIVVDDGSTDNTWETLQEYASKDQRFKIFKRHREPKGAPTCRNIGIDLAKGSYLMFMDSDDLMGKHCLIFRYEQSIKHQECDALIFDTSIFRSKIGDDSRIWNKLELYGKKDLIRFLQQDMPWSISGPLWKKNSIIPFDEEALSYQDWEFHIRILLKNTRYMKFESFLKSSHIFCRRTDMYMSITNSFKCKIQNENKVKLFKKIAKMISVKNRDEDVHREVKKLLLRTAINLKLDNEMKKSINLWGFARSILNLGYLEFHLWLAYICFINNITKKPLEFIAYRIFRQYNMLNIYRTHLIAVKETI